MSKLLSQKTAQALLEDHGWEATIGGKHNVKMAKAGHRPITLPQHRGQDYGKGLTRSILRAAGIDPSEL
jgi:predicted RNA binding protein YcfA (HicA-like mRNA interferase family)